MGASAYILFEAGKSKSASELVSLVLDLCDKENLFFAFDIERFDNANRLKYKRLGISNISFSERNSSKQICLNIYDEPYQFQLEQFDWDILHKDYFNAISLEFFVENEDLLLKIIYPLLKAYPQAKLWCDNDWFYTSADLEKIVNKPFDKYWCYKNPVSLP